ncbi:MAG: beta-ketoacyl-ACP synthase 3, partial [Atopostipes suicloacalis]|nr:beta-ketoacyl-ACP synthase 3 [Atopostipes suicloacalis]
PGKSVSNKELIKETGIDSSDEWIFKRTGILERHFASKKETVSDLAIKSAENLLAKVDQEVIQNIQLIIVASMSSLSPTPSIASQVQAALGIKESWSFDINGACSGFIMALEAAEKIGASQSNGYTLIIGAEKMSNVLDFNDRSTSVLFGDGAGAILIANDGKGLMDYQSNLKSIPDVKESIHFSKNQLMSMAGRSVFDFVLRKVLPSTVYFVEEKGRHFDYLISHQANQRFIKMLAKELNGSVDHLPTNIERVANTSAASIPILLDELVVKEKILLDESQKVILLGYGGGLSWGQISLTL